MNHPNENHVPDRADAQVPLMAALAALLALSLFMAVAAFTGIVPSPPHDKLPFVAANIALAVAALVGVACVHLFGASAWTLAPAVGLAIAAMMALRCLHPPGGATALLAAWLGALRACTVAIRCGAGTSSSCGWSRSSGTFT